MSSRKKFNVELLLSLPWWLIATMGVLVFIGLRWGLPLWAGDDKNRHLFIDAAVGIAPAILIFFALVSATSFWFSWHRSRLLEQQTGITSIRALSWKQFEFLVAEAYRRQGYQVEFSLGCGADGGVDLTLHLAGRTSLVQCKHWKVFSVGAPIIREMFGLMTAEKADESIIVTSGKFTRDAQEFAIGKPIQLINGPQLLDLIHAVQKHPVSVKRANEVSPIDASVPTCPNCGQSMVLRMAKRGVSSGNQFWGCSAYPTCKGTRNLAKTGI
jgi:restriction system protein